MQTQQFSAQATILAERAALAKVLEENDTYFQAEREWLFQWAEDQLLSAQQAPQDTRRG